MSVSPVIFWFRRDLRLDDNIGLLQAIESGRPVLPLFILDPALQRGTWFSRKRQALLFSALRSLDTRLRQLGTRLTVLEGAPLPTLARLAAEVQPAALHFNRDYTPFARKRDRAVARELGLPVHAWHDNLLIAPEELHKRDGEPYRVYTAFRRRWLRLPKPGCVERELRAGDFCSADIVLSRRAGIPWRGASLSVARLPPTDEASAQRSLNRFAESGISDYAATRNLLAPVAFDASDSGFSSCLSPYLRLGILSPRQVYWAARARLNGLKSDLGQRSIDTFCDQLIWREFFMRLMYHFPRVRHENFRPEFDAMPWRKAPDELAAWKAGQTGYPIVDAAMRQLAASGWMPNRARLITASFLTKHLLIDWREGEAHFMQYLLDGDPAVNNGNWQWVAGAGADAQPYFRIFNPVRQSRRFDPDAGYIRRWLPELRDLPQRWIHEPGTAPKHLADYPAPIVDHRAARARALAAFRHVRAYAHCR